MKQGDMIDVGPFRFIRLYDLASLPRPGIAGGLRDGYKPWFEVVAFRREVRFNVHPWRWRPLRQKF